MECGSLLPLFFRAPIQRILPHKGVNYGRLRPDLSRGNVPISAALLNAENALLLDNLVATVTAFRINTYKSVSKLTTLTSFRMNTYEKTGGGVDYC